MRANWRRGSAFPLACLLVACTSSRLFSQAANASAQPGVPSAAIPAAPIAPVRPVIDDYFGTKIEDPYRYMENLKDPEVASWMKAQGDYAHTILSGLPGRAQLLARIKELDQTVPKVEVTPLPGDLFLIYKRLPQEDTYKLYLRRGVTGEDHLLVDPEQIVLAPEIRGKGKSTIQYFTPSSDNKYLAVGVAPGGAELDAELHVIEIASGRETGDVISHAAWDSVITWLPDNRSFIYDKLQKLPPGAPVTDMEQKLRAYVHVLGEKDPDKDPAVFGYQVVPSIDVDPKLMSFVLASPASDYAVAHIYTGVSRNRAWYIEPTEKIGTANAAWFKVADFADDVADVQAHGNDVYVLSYHNALRYKLLRTDARHPDLGTAETIVAPSQVVLNELHPAQDALYVQVLDGSVHRVLRVPYGPHPQVEEISLPIRGAVDVVTDPRVPGALLTLTSWRQAAKIYAYDPQSKQVRDTKLQPAGPYDQPANLESVEVKVVAADGVEVPLSITYARGLKLDGSNPTLLDGYGAYGYLYLPNFDPTRLAWYEKGGVFAVCHVRGGGEYGEEWHLAGKQATKPNTWRDFIACAQYLIDQKYTSSARLAGTGTSAGGITIGRSITERPGLFAAAIDRVGLSDALRFETSANGVPNIAEFGSTQTKDGFQALYEMSAYDHVRPHTAYPAVLFETGLNDSRLDPWQVAKMTARVQAATASGKPVLLRVESEGGHGRIGGTEKQKQELFADEWSFLLWQFNE